MASLEVPKDASATAIYGVNGTNGVILITTRRGATGKPVTRYNGYAGNESLAHSGTPEPAGISAEIPKIGRETITPAAGKNHSPPF